MQFKAKKSIPTLEETDPKTAIISCRRFVQKIKVTQQMDISKMVTEIEIQENYGDILNETICVWKKYYMIFICI